MTETEWLECADPQPMLAFLSTRKRGKVSDRKLRLFAVACCRRVDYVIDRGVSVIGKGDYRRAVEVTERYADGEADDKQLSDAYWGADDNAFQNDCGADPFLTAVSSDTRRLLGLWEEALQVVRVDIESRRELDWESAVRQAGEAMQREREAQAQLIREVFGSPFRRITTNKKWLKLPVVELAKNIYRERTFQARRIYGIRTFQGMPELADALEEAGCPNPDILAHCRQPGEHVRGCWVMDLILGKE